MNLQAEQACSVMEFCRANVEKYRMFLSTGDILDSKPLRGKPTDDRAKRVEAEVQQAIEMIRRGASYEMAARRLGITGNSLQQRFYTRGLTASKIRKEHND